MLNKKRESNQENQTPDDITEPSSEIETSGNESTEISRHSSGNCGGGLTERLRNIMSEDDGGDLLLQQSDQEDNVLQWLQALDLQVIGACRADERLKPLLKLNVSSGVAEDRLLAHLSQHFEVPEVGMLARCLCIPLVSIRVGKITRQGLLLCPTGTRGNLNLALLPSSGLRISYAGDDGCIERLATLSYDSESLVAVEEIPADKSGRSFLVKLPDGQTSFFWCSEQSKFLGFELLAKMKDLLRRKPSLAELTGISESRLDCFAGNFRSFLGATVNNKNTNSAYSSTSTESDSSFQVRSSSVKPSRSRCIYQGSLSPRSSSFKDGALRNSSIKNGVREKFRRRGDTHCIFSAIDSSKSVTEVSSKDHTESREVSECISCPLSPLSFLDSIGNSTFLPSSALSSPGLPPPQSSIHSSVFSPFYCWCPPCTSSLQYTVTPPHLLIPSMESVSLPPLSTLLSAAMPSNSLSPPNLPHDLAGDPSMDFPTLLPDPIRRLPLSVPTFVTVSCLHKIPTFTPLMCDPIVHIPVIDVCSSGQGYLVSAGPAVSTAISPSHPNFVNPMIHENESPVEKNARETLRLLIRSTQTNPQLMDVLPSHSMVVGSGGLYSGTRDVETIANSMAAMKLVSSPQIGVDVTRAYTDGNGDPEGCCCVDGDAKDLATINDKRESSDAA